MKQKNSYIKESSGHVEIGRTILRVSIILLTLLISACANKMSLEEARQTTASFGSSGFVPPPRTIADITALLDEYKHDPEVTAKRIALAEARPDPGLKGHDLARFYADRAVAAGRVGRLRQRLMDHRLAFRHATGIPSGSEYISHALAEYVLGDFNAAIKALEDCVTKTGNAMCLFLIGWWKAQKGDFQEGREAMKKGQSMIRSWDIVNPWRAVQLPRSEADLLEIQGKFSEAEPYRREALNAAIRLPNLDLDSKVLHVNRDKLGKNLAKQGKLVEAEVFFRENVIDSLKTNGKHDLLNLWWVQNLASILNQQGRFQEAERLEREVLKSKLEIGVPKNSFSLGLSQVNLGITLATQKKWRQAGQHFLLAIESLQNQPGFYNRLIVPHSITIGLTQIKTGQPAEALVFLQKTIGQYRNAFGDSHPRTKQIRGLMALAQVMTGETKAALASYRQVLPTLLAKNDKIQKDPSRRMALLESFKGYLKLLSQIKGTSLEPSAKLDVTAESFRVAAVVRSQSVQGALAQSGARAALTDPQLAEIARREQDSIKQIEALEGQLSNYLSLPKAQQDSKVKANLLGRIKSLKQAQIILKGEIEKKFPSYAELTDPKPATLEQVQKALAPGEAMIVLFVSDKQTYIWGIPRQGRAVFKTVPVGRGWLEKNVARLRASLDAPGATFGEIPEFDLAASYDLYRRLLAPVQSAWKGANHLIVVPHGALGRLPLGLLTTAPVKLPSESGLLFERYRKAPWLIRQVAVTRVPSATSFVSLRGLPPGDPKRRAFAGFGDSWFNPEQAILAEKEKGVLDTSTILAMNTRGIRITSRPGSKKKSQGAQASVVNLDDSGANSVRLEMLQRLPDTRGEINEIAKILGADPKQDVFLGRAARESRVKTMNLSNRRVIAFATHALVPGDLDGLRQPALALSSPSVTGGKGDGLLTMEEVMSLRLNADWVVLSACNTASADGKGAEAVSGLGRAFFYAGTRALLVSHWPVETTSATLLTTGIFRGQQKNPHWSRARALQQSMLHLIDRGVLKERSTGRKVISYAHPVFWAPFTLVGDGGGGVGSIMK